MVDFQPSWNFGAMSREIFLQLFEILEVDWERGFSKGKRRTKKRLARYDVLDQTSPPIYVLQNYTENFKVSTWHPLNHFMTPHPIHLTLITGLHLKAM